MEECTELVPNFEGLLVQRFARSSVLFLFNLILYVPSTISHRDGSSWVEPVLSWDKCVLLKDHNGVTLVRLEPVASRSRVKHSTTEPLRSLQVCCVHEHAAYGKVLEILEHFPSH